MQPTPALCPGPMASRPCWYSWNSDYTHCGYPGSSRPESRFKPQLGADLDSGRPEPPPVREGGLFGRFVWLRLTFKCSFSPSVHNAVAEPVSI